MARDRGGGPNLDALIVRAARKAGVPPDLYRRLILRGERSHKGWQVSPAGAGGPAQLMPRTAQSLARKYKINTNDYYGNLLGGAYYLREQLDQFGDPKLAVAAYNAGPGAVMKYHGVPPYRETQDYVRNVFSGSIPTVTEGGAMSGAEPGAGPATGATSPSVESNALALIDWTRPSEASVGILERLGGTAARVAQSAQEPLYNPATAPKESPLGSGLPTPQMPMPTPAQGTAAPAKGMNKEFQRRLNALIAAVKKRGGQLYLSSGWRSNAQQTALWNAAVQKYGSPEAARKWVAPPGRSKHEHGFAGDLRGDLDLAHQLAPQFGLVFPLSNEAWHIELQGARR